MTTKPVQFFTEEYLRSTAKMSVTERAKFLEEFRQLVASRESQGPTKLISIKIPEGLLAQFRARCDRENIPYQRKIKSLMLQWLQE